MEPEYNAFSVRYVFRPQQGPEVNYTLRISEKDMVSENTPPPTPPEWTKLDYHQCEGCEWKKTDRCPIAERLVEPIRIFGNVLSHETVDIEVHTEERIFSRHTDIQQGLSSLFGLIMATSGCPAMEEFKPMARFHLPFATFEETLYRMFSTYLLRHYFRGTLKQAEEQSVADLSVIYNGAARVNHGIIDRLRAATVAEKDSAFNAVIILDVMTTLVPLSVEDGLKELEGLFEPRQT